jgi:hypothetical protein
MLMVCHAGIVFEETQKMIFGEAGITRGPVKRQVLLQMRVDMFQKTGKLFIIHQNMLIFCLVFFHTIKAVLSDLGIHLQKFSEDHEFPHALRVEINIGYIEQVLPDFVVKLRLAFL